MFLPNECPGLWLGQNIKWHEMENEKKTMWVFLHIKYVKFWSISPGHFIKHKPLISEEWSSSIVIYHTSITITQWMLLSDYFAVFIVVFFNDDWLDYSRSEMGGQRSSNCSSSSLWGVQHSYCAVLETFLYIVVVYGR